jgi:hypothetical protein
MSLVEHYKKKKKGVEKWAKHRAYISRFISKAQAHLKDPGPSEHNLKKVLERRVRTEEAREAQKARSKRRDRMLQLAKMPGGKGMTELKRLRKQKSGSYTWSESQKMARHQKDAGLKESEMAKKDRQRKAQLEKMPGGRGKMPSDKQIDKGSKQLESQRKAAAGQDVGAQKRKAEMEQNQKAKEVEAAKQKKAVEEGRKRQATKQAEAKKAADKQATDKSAKDKVAKQTAARKKDAEEKRKAEMKKKLEALRGRKA